MTSNRRRIHRVARIVGHRRGQRRSDDLPDPGFAPPSEALIDRRPFAVLLRHIALQNPINDGPVIMCKPILTAAPPLAAFPSAAATRLKTVSPESTVLNQNPSHMSHTL